MSHHESSIVTWVVNESIENTLVLTILLLATHLQGLGVKMVHWLRQQLLAKLTTGLVGKKVDHPSI